MQIPGASTFLPIHGAHKTQAAEPTSFFATAPEAPTGAEAEFLKRARMSFAEQMRAQVLDALGLDEEKLKAMSPEDREALESKIKAMMKARIEEAQEEKTGVFVDLTV